MGNLNLGDIQGNILRAYNFGAGSHYFVHLGDHESGRALLRTLLPEITNARPWSTPPVVALNVALTYAGLQTLGVDESILALLPPAFRDPIRQRAPIQLGDDPEEWDDVFGNEETHLLVLLATSEQPWTDDEFEWRYPKLRRARGWLEARLQDHGACPLFRQDVEALPAESDPDDTQPRPREHFGFADGFGQPAVEGMTNNWPGQGVPEPETGFWRDIKAGEFILGHSNEDGESVPDPAAWLLYDGSFMVYRKLEQDVARFRRVVAAEAGAYAPQLSGLEQPLTPREGFDLMAAKIVGRWQEGAPLELDPGPRQAYGVNTSINGRADNNFRYDEDLEGRACPLGAHVRRANPRDLLGRDHQESARHRIIRRGMPYGPPYDGPWDGDDEAEPGRDRRERGLIFICFNADFERQFEVVLGQWLNDGSALGLGDTRDFLLGTRPASRLAIGGDTPYFVTRDERLVQTKGCEYLFMPGLAALERLSAPPSGASQLEDIPAREPEAIHEIVEAVSKQMYRTYSVDRPVMRGQHPKSHACVKADFIVEDVPEALRVGVFNVETTKTYKAWVRFSASHPILRSDARADAQGIAIKLLGVKGEKILPHERWAWTQDFILVNHENFFLRSAMDVAHFAKAISATGSILGLPIASKVRLLEFLGRDYRSAGILRQMLATKPDNPLDVTFWSETPYALGDHAVKYMVRPAQPRAGPMGEKPDDWDSLEDAMQKALEPDDAEFQFEFLVQRQADASTMPVENPMIPWSEHEAPFRKVATIRIAHQHFTLQHRRNFGENLMFTPWHSLWEHRPLGGVNRVRRWVYHASSNLRHELNGAPYFEPGGLIGPRSPRLRDTL
jgi:Dyp-type peroxidase family